MVAAEAAVNRPSVRLSDFGVTVSLYQFEASVKQNKLMAPATESCCARLEPRGQIEGTQGRPSEAGEAVLAPLSLWGAANHLGVLWCLLRHPDPCLLSTACPHGAHLCSCLWLSFP